MLFCSYQLTPKAWLSTPPADPAIFSSHPLKALRLSSQAHRMLRHLPASQPLPNTWQTHVFFERKVGQGLLKRHFTLSPYRAVLPLFFEVIVPAFNPTQGLLACLQALDRQQNAPPFCVSVVDDASTMPVAHCFEQAPWINTLKYPLRLMRLAQNSGPASARNLAAFTPWPTAKTAKALQPDPRLASTNHLACAPLFFGTPYPHMEAKAHTPRAQRSQSVLAFLDADCKPMRRWLATLAALLEGPYIDAAGTRVSSLRPSIRNPSRAHSTPPSWVQRYEDACSALQMGYTAHFVGGPGTGPGYLPSCNLAVRRSAFVAAGGFANGWRVGEDVDLCWRLLLQQTRMVYWPSLGVRHRHRHRVTCFWKRRAFYARSEFGLKKRYPQRFKQTMPWLLGLNMALGILVCSTLLLGAHAFGVNTKLVVPVTFLIPLLPCLGWVWLGLKPWLGLLTVGTKGRGKRRLWRDFRMSYQRVNRVRCQRGGTTQGLHATPVPTIQRAHKPFWLTKAPFFVGAGIRASMGAAIAHCRRWARLHALTSLLFLVGLVGVSALRQQLWPLPFVAFILGCLGLAGWGDWHARRLWQKGRRILNPWVFAAGWALECLAYSWGIGCAHARHGKVSGWVFNIMLCKKNRPPLQP